MYKTFFFDLDGTLVPMDQDEFLLRYFKLVMQFANDHGFDGEKFVTVLNLGVRAMMEDIPGKSNYDKFWDYFMEHYADSTLSQRQIEDVLTEFYEGPFGTLGADVVPDPNAARAVNTLYRKGYTLYLTTMPLFPRVAVDWRLKWGGIEPKLFTRVTTYDNSCRTKPSLAYYRQNLELTGCKPEEIMMVGNNATEDMAAHQLGIDCYLVTDGLLNPDNVDINQYRHSSLAEFADFVDTLPDCEA